MPTPLIGLTTHNPPTPTDSFPLIDAFIETARQHRSNRQAYHTQTELSA
jgi:hypothetical protein